METVKHAGQGGSNRWTDGDELPDTWEQSEFGDLTEGPDGDFDSDGQSNRSEYFAGTDPTSSDSVLALEVFEHNRVILKLRWPVAEGKFYQVHFKPALEANWQLINQTYSMVEHATAELIVAADQQAGFYRIQVNE